MEVLAAVAIGLLIAASIGVGVRLIALHRRSRAAPELLLGLMLLLSVGIGYPVLIAASRAGPDLIRPLLIISMLGVNLGFGLLFVFTWRVFRPGSAWARNLAGAGIFAMLLSAGWRTFDALSSVEPRISADMLGQTLLQTGAVIAAYGWTGWESLRYHGLMRRRVRLGLADPVVSDRFLLWGMMSVLVISGVLLNAVAAPIGIDIFESPGILLASSACGLGQAVLLVLAFVPPRSYLSWVRARAAAMGA